jgi:hypothetical protein
MSKICLSRGKMQKIQYFQAFKDFLLHIVSFYKHIFFIHALTEQAEMKFGEKRKILKNIFVPAKNLF